MTEIRIKYTEFASWTGRSRADRMRGMMEILAAERLVQALPLDQTYAKVSGLLALA